MISSNTFQAAAIVSKGNSALGTDFRMGGFASNSPKGGHLNFVSVMATEDNTTVTFDDFSPGIVINNYTGSIPFNTTVYPSVPNLLATSNPIPPVAPVTTAIFPLLLIFIVLFLFLI